MRYYSIFSGIEAASVAWGPLKWTPLLFSEIDEFPSAVLKERFPNVPNLGDITKINWKEAVRDFGKPDLVVGGSPCQSFSIAGSRTGLDGASGLMWEYVRCVREVKPDWILWENVPGALSSSNGEDFRCLLEALDALGYGLAWRVLDAQFFGVAQRRERVFLVGRLGDPGGPCEVLFEPESLRWDTPTSREKRKELAGGAGGGPEAAGSALSPSVLCMAGQQSNSMVSGEVCGTLTAHEAQGGSIVCYQSSRVADGYAVRRLVPLECERLQGFPYNWTKVPYMGRLADECPDTPRYRAVGNSMAVPVMRWIGERMELAERGES